MILRSQNLTTLFRDTDLSSVENLRNVYVCETDLTKLTLFWVVWKQAREKTVIKKIALASGTVVQRNKTLAWCTGHLSTQDWRK